MIKVRISDTAWNTVHRPDRRTLAEAGRSPRRIPPHGTWTGAWTRVPYYCLQEDEACLVDAGEDHHTEISTEGFDGEIGVVAALIGGTENIDELTGKTFSQYKCQRTHQSLSEQQPGEQLPDTELLFRTHVVAHNGNAACRHTTTMEMTIWKNFITIPRLP